MRGKSVILGLLAFTAVFAVALWYFQTRAWYEEVTGLMTITAGGQEVNVDDYHGLTGNSPQKLRGCFRVDPAALAHVPVAEQPVPISAPHWFDCFDHGALTVDLAEGRATAYLAVKDVPQDFEIIVAVYPDGRGYLWRQLGAAFRN